MMIFTRAASTAARYSSGKPALIVATIYSALVAVAAVVVVSVLLLADDPGFIGIWLLLVSQPTSLLLVEFTEPLGLDGAPGAAVMVTLCVAAGFAQAWMLWRLFRGRRSA